MGLTETYWKDVARERRTCSRNTGSNESRVEISREAGKQVQDVLRREQG